MLIWMNWGRRWRTSGKTPARTIHPIRRVKEQTTNRPRPTQRMKDELSTDLNSNPNHLTTLKTASPPNPRQAPPPERLPRSTLKTSSKNEKENEKENGVKFNIHYEIS